MELEHGAGRAEHVCLIPRIETPLHLRQKSRGEWFSGNVLNQPLLVPTQHQRYLEDAHKVVDYEFFETPIHGR